MRSNTPTPHTDGPEAEITHREPALADCDLALMIGYARLLEDDGWEGAPRMMRRAVAEITALRAAHAEAQSATQPAPAKPRRKPRSAARASAKPL